MNPSPPLPSAEAPPPSPLTVAVQAWDRFWFSRGDPTTLGLIRIMVGLLAFYVHLTYSWGLLDYVGPEGWMDYDLHKYVRREVPQYGLGSGWDEPFTPVAKGNFFWSIYSHVTDTGWIVAIHVTFLVAMLLFTAGLWTRWTSIASWLGALMYVQRASTTVFGLDTMLM